jgi:hypothetical protein
MPLPKSEYQAVPTEEPKREPPKRKESWPKNPDLASSASADEVELNGDDKIDQAIQDIAAAPAQDTRIFESFIFDNLRDFDWQLRCVRFEFSECIGPRERARISSRHPTLFQPLNCFTFSVPNSLFAPTLFSILCLVSCIVCSIE